jgi:CheY-like chemotaxis protein
VSDLAISLGWEAVVARDGAEALSLYKEREPDLVLLDYMMPKINGLEVLDMLRMGGSQVPIIITTAASEADLIVEALRLGATDFLRKPFEHLVLLKNILGRQNQRYRLRQIEILANSRIINQSVEFDIENDFSVASCVCRYITDRMAPPENAYAIRLGLEELVANAIEHGNLGFSREEKSSALSDDTMIPWSTLVAERAEQSPWSARRVRIIATVEGSKLEFMIQDGGEGFDFHNLPDPLSEENLLLPSGRGVFLARQQFDALEYFGRGNIVRAHITLGKPRTPQLLP